MKRRGLVFLSLAGMACCLFPQYKPWFNHYNFVYGTKAMSLGNAFTAVADDLTAVFWNPAGLAVMRSPEFYFAYQAEKQGQYSDPQTIAVPGDTKQYDFDFSSKLQQINFFSVSAPAEFWKMKWGFALSYYRYIPYGFTGSAVETFSFASGSAPPTTRTVTFLGSEGVDVLAFTAAFGITEYVALGCTVQQFFGSGTRHFQIEDATGEFHQQYSENLRGRNFVFGVLFRPFKALSLGFTFHSGLKDNLDSSLLTWERDAQGSDVNQAANASQAQMVIPSQYSLGALLRPAGWLNLSLDYSHADWRKGTVANYYEPGEVLPYPQGIFFSRPQKAINNLRLGMEINLPLRLFLLHLRGGWSADRQLYADNDDRSVAINAYAAGIGVEFSRSLLLEVAYQCQNAHWNENGYFSKSQAVANHFSADLLKFSLIYRFGRIFQE